MQRDRTRRPVRPLVGLLDGVDERLPAGKSVLDLVPPFERFFAESPAKVHDASLVLVGEIHEARDDVLHYDAGFSNRLVCDREGRCVLEVGRAIRGASAKIGGSPGTVDVFRESDECPAMAAHLFEEIAQPGEQCSGFGDGEGLFVHEGAL